MIAGEWTRSSSLLETRGIQFRREAALKFTNAVIASSKRGDKFGILIEREPKNSFDKNALKVIGWWPSHREHVGYVDRFEAARHAERFPKVALTAEFYNVYLSTSDFVDIRFFLCAPRGVLAKQSAQISKLFEVIRDELIVLNYMTMSDGKRGRFENQVLNKYVLERSNDLSIYLDEEEIDDIKKWMKDQSPHLDEMMMAVDRIADKQTISATEIWELAQIIVGIDGKITKEENIAMQNLARQLAVSFGSTFSYVPVIGGSS